MRTEFNEVWLKNVSLKRVREVFKSDKILLNKAIQRRKELRGGN